MASLVFSPQSKMTIIPAFPSPKEPFSPFPFLPLLQNSAQVRRGKWGQEIKETSGEERKTTSTNIYNVITYFLLIKTLKLSTIMFISCIFAILFDKLGLSMAIHQWPLSFELTFSSFNRSQWQPFLILMLLYTHWSTPPCSPTQTLVHQNKRLKIERESSSCTRANVWAAVSARAERLLSSAKSVPVVVMTTGEYVGRGRERKMTQNMLFTHIDCRRVGTNIMTSKEIQSTLANDLILNVS